MVDLKAFSYYFKDMNTRISKVIPGMLATIACMGITSCSLFKDGKYASQFEVETEVPASMDEGKPSTGPSPRGAGSRSGDIAVNSNLADLPELASSTPRPAPRRTIPKPRFESTKRSAPAQRLDIPPPSSGSDTLPPGVTAGGLDNELPSNPESLSNLAGLKDPSPQFPPTSEMPPDTAPSLPEGMEQSGPIDFAMESSTTNGVTEFGPTTTPPPSTPNIASAPPALPPLPSKAETAPAVPLLHGENRLSDFYSNMHQGLVEGDVVQNQVIADPTAPSVSADPGTSNLSGDTEVPAPPPEPAQ